MHSGGRFHSGFLIIFVFELICVNTGHTAYPCPLDVHFFLVFLECCGIVFASIFIFLGSCCCFKQPAWEGKAFVRERLSHSMMNKLAKLRRRCVSRVRQTDRQIDRLVHSSQLIEFRGLELCQSLILLAWKSIWRRNISIRASLVCLLDVET